MSSTPFLSEGIFTLVVRSAAGCVASNQGIITRARTIASTVRDLTVGSKYTYKHDDFFYHVLVGESEVVFLVCARTEYPRIPAFECLYKMKQAHSTVGARNAPQLAHELAVLATRYSSPDNFRVAQIHQQVDEVRGIVSGTIDKMDERGKMVDAIAGAVADLRDETESLVDVTSDLRCKMWCRKISTIIVATALIVVLVVAAVALLVLALCHQGGVNVDKCFS